MENSSIISIDDKELAKVGLSLVSSVMGLRNSLTGMMWFHNPICTIALLLVVLLYSIRYYSLYYCIV